MVFGFAAATASMSRVWPSGIAMSSRSKPSDSQRAGRPANTTAASAARAAASASDSSSGVVSPLSVQPGAKAAHGMASSALVTRVGFMWLEPAP